MKIRIHYYLCIFILLCNGYGYGRTLQTPLPFEAYFRNQLNAYARSDDTDWYVDLLAGCYSRNAHNAFASDCDCIAANRISLAALFLNQTSFSISQAMGTDIPFPSINAFIYSCLSPCIKYTDSGGVIMAHATKQISSMCETGVRAQLPFRSIHVKVKSGGSGSSLLGGESIDDVVVFREDTVDGATVNDFAFRLDFLSQLPADCALPGLVVPFVNYHNGSFPGLPITISNLDVTNNPNLDNLPSGPDNRNAVTVLQSCGIPQGTLGVAQADVQSLPLLSSDGSSLTSGGRALFNFTTNYSPLASHPCTQSCMWIVPTVDVTDDDLVSRAAVIETQVERLLTCVQLTPEAFFQQCAGMSFGCVQESGIGDLDVDVFTRYYPCDNVELEGFIGFRFPTAKRTNPHQVFALPLGNNGHTEVKVGTHMRGQPCDWFVANLDLLYSKVCSSGEAVAAPFFGSTVKNLGPLLCAQIGWGYVQMHLDATGYFFRTKCVDGYVHLGYELYYKGKDNVLFNQYQAYDCFGVLQPLNPCLLTQNTRQLSNKLYGDVALEWHPLSWLTSILFVGFNSVVAGNNVPKENGFQIAVQCLMEL